MDIREFLHGYRSAMAEETNEDCGYEIDSFYVPRISWVDEEEEFTFELEFVLEEDEDDYDVMWED